MKRCQDYPKLDLFSEECENPHVEKVHWAEIKTSTILGKGLTSIRFENPKASGRKLIDLSRAQLAIHAVFGHTSRAPLPSPVNNVLHSMTENCIIKLNDDVLSDSNKHYHYNAYLMDLMDRSQEQKEGLMTAQGWYPDTPNHFDNVEAGTGNKNKGFKIRQDTRLIDRRLHSELFNQECYFINDVNITIELTFAEPAFFLLAKSDAPGDFPITIDDAKMNVPYVHVSEKTMDEIERTLKTKPVKYLIQRIHTKSFPIDTKSTSVTIEEISRGQMPKKIVVGVVTDKRENGDMKLNPFNIDGGATEFNIKKIELNVDGMPYSKRGFTPDFKKDDYGKSFMNFYESLNFTKDGTNTPAIPIADYKNGYCLYTYNLHPGCCSDPGVFKKDGLLSLDIEFEKAPTETLQVILLGVYDNTISIDKHRHFSKDW